MPSDRTKFNERWLDELDINGVILRKWCFQGNTEHFARCDNRGLKQLIQHSKGIHHKKICKSILSSSQTKLVFKLIPALPAGPCPKEPGPSTNKHTEGTKLMYTFSGEDELAAEIIWAVKYATSNIIFRACDGISETFRVMFKCKISDGFSVGRRKLSYMLTDGLHHHAFLKALLYDVNNSQTYFTLQCDETTQAQVKKQMNPFKRYWSPTHEEVWCRYYKSLFFSHADGKAVSRSVFAAVQEDRFPLDMLSALGSDGPNVNKTINRELSVLIKDACPKWHVDTCNLHTMHNAFCKGIYEYGEDVKDFALSWFSLFKISAGLKDDYRQIQEDVDLKEELFIKHS
jgi:hypothetical protein